MKRRSSEVPIKRPSDTEISKVSFNENDSCGETKKMCVVRAIESKYLYGREQCVVTQTRRKTKRGGRPRSLQDAVTPASADEAIANRYGPHHSNSQMFSHHRDRALTLARKVRSSASGVVRTGRNVPILWGENASAMTE